MKYCKKCNRVYNQEARFCASCGGPLEESLKTDIFGDIMDERVNNKNIDDTKNGNYCIYADKDIVNRNINIAKAWTIISTILWLVPTIGLIEIGISLFNNYKLYKAKLLSIKYIIIPAVCLVLSIIFTLIYIIYIQPKIQQ